VNINGDCDGPGERGCCGTRARGSIARQVRARAAATEAPMRIETMTAGMAVHVTTAGESVELRIGEAADPGARAVTLSPPQAAMVLHALGLGIAEIDEARRRVVEQQARIAQVMADTEIRRR
jgi:hypothetical protein